MRRKTMSADNNLNMSIREFFIRGAIWGGFAYAKGARGQELNASIIFGPVFEKLSDFSLGNTLITAIAEQYKNNDNKTTSTSNEKSSEADILPIMAEEVEQVPAIVPKIKTQLNYKWLDVIKPPAIVVVLGNRGTGKSATCYSLLEHFKYKLDVFVVGFPEQGKVLLPDWIGIAKSLEEVPSNTISIVDEAYLSHHARGSMSKENKNICRLLNLSRQENKTVVFIAQQGRQLDIDIVSSADVLIFKNPGMLQHKFERPGLRDVLIEAQQAFGKVRGDTRRWSYVYSQSSNFAGLIENELPKFWNKKLSNIYGCVTETAETKMPDKMSLEEKIIKANELYQKGWSLSKIAKYLGVSKSTVYNWVHDYPYRNKH